MKISHCSLNEFETHVKLIIRILSFLLLILIVNIQINAQNYNRGIGIYPGSPKENFSPIMKTDTKNYRNIALLKPVYCSGSYDYNLTAQLITDGIIETKMPGWIVTTTSDGTLPRNERDYFIDRHAQTRKEFDGNNAWIQMELAGNYVIPKVNGFKLSGNISTDTAQTEIKFWQITVSGSNNGKDWKILAKLTDNKILGDTLTGFWRIFYPKNYRVFKQEIKLDEAVNYKFYHADFSSPNVKTWFIGEFAMTNDGNYCNIGGPYNFSSAWKSLGSKKEWIYVDLGALCSFDNIKLYWLKRAASGTVQVSDDSKAWKEISALPTTESLIDDIKFNKPIEGRYVRLMLDDAASEEDGYILSEMEVFGEGASSASPHAQANIEKDGNIKLSGGRWKVQRSSLVKDSIGEVSKVGFNDSAWITATVPGTVLSSYINAGIIPDPNYSDNMLLISDSYFYSDFWYRDEFTVPKNYNGKKIFLNFNGINWKADIYLNGKNLGRIDGAFTRGKFDVTNDLITGGKNAVAVRIYKNDAPGFVKEPTVQSHDANGGELGVDNPTFHASVGWDWIPTIRGRNIGIWDDVYLTASGPVTIDDPFVNASLPLPDTAFADLKIQVTLTNHSAENILGDLKGKIGNVKFELPVALLPSELKTITIDSSNFPSLHFKNPKLWWPNGYGEQNLYNVKLEFLTANGKISDTKEFKAGLREMTYSIEGGALRIWVNGKRFIGRGGNWGFSESNLNYRSREFDIAVRYHKEMNFTMIRNWVGQTGNDEFYEACDRYGIMVWQDFWLANPLDGPNPEDNKMFLQNAEDFVKRIRNHPSIGLYCGRNEGNPPDEIDKPLREILVRLTPGIQYIPNSAFDVVSGGGPYRAMPVKYYFDKRATPKFHSEIGMPNIVSPESFKQMIPDSDAWPINRFWGIHDFNLESAQSGKSFINLINESFGKIDDLKDWLAYAQWINYQGYRAIFEAQSKNRMGILLWMSHPAWPSLVWQTYDYYFEPTAAYFGCKKANEPLHIQWNALTDSIEVVNYSSSSGNGLEASVELLNLDGTVKLKKHLRIDCPIDAVKHIYKLEKTDGLSNVYFTRLRLLKGKKLVSENFYWNGLKEGNVKDIRYLPKIKLDVATKSVKKNGKWYLSTELKNSTITPALMVRLNVVGDKDKERILPAIYSDNYVSLMPGERRIIKIEMDNSDTRGNKPKIRTEGINIK
jgi:hypothetical protein